MPFAYTKDHRAQRRASERRWEESNREQINARRRGKRGDKRGPQPKIKPAPTGFRWCKTCDLCLPISAYRPHKTQTRHVCRECERRWERMNRDQINLRRRVRRPEKPEAVAKMLAIKSAPEGFRWCRKCDNCLPLDAFNSHKSKVRRVCGECAKRDAYERRHRNIEATRAKERAYATRRYHAKVKHTRLTKLYGISRDELDRLLADQDWTCRICGRRIKEGPDAPPYERVTVDHCHETIDPCVDGRTLLSVKALQNKHNSWIAGVRLTGRGQ